MIMTLCFFLFPESKKKWTKGGWAIQSGCYGCRKSNGLLNNRCIVGLAECCWTIFMLSAGKGDWYAIFCVRPSKGGLRINGEGEGYVEERGIKDRCSDYRAGRSCKEVAEGKRDGVRSGNVRVRGGAGAWYIICVTLGQNKTYHHGTERIRKENSWQRGG